MLESTFRYWTYSVASFSVGSFSETSSHGPPSNKAVTPILNKWNDDNQLAFSSSNGVGLCVFRKHWNHGDKRFENEQLHKSLKQSFFEELFWSMVPM